jgi:hypothetical protein
MPMTLVLQQQTGFSERVNYTGIAEDDKNVHHKHEESEEVADTETIYGFF